MTRVEIRWIEKGPHDRIDTFSGYLREAEGLDAPTAVEEVFQEWLESNVGGKGMVVTHVEIYVDGKFYPLSTAEENDYLVRIDAASSKDRPKPSLDSVHST